MGCMRWLKTGSGCVQGKNASCVKINRCRSRLTHLSLFAAQAHSRTCSTAFSLSVTGAEVRKDTEHLLESGTGTTEGISVEALVSCWQHSHLAWLCPKKSQNDHITVEPRPRCMSCRGRHAETRMTAEWQKDNTLKTHTQTHPADYFGPDSWLNFSYIYFVLLIICIHFLQNSHVYCIFFCLHRLMTLCSLNQQITWLFYQESSKQTADENLTMRWATCVQRHDLVWLLVSVAWVVLLAALAVHLYVQEFGPTNNPLRWAQS